jgi:subtilisin family serine protease
VLNAPGPNVPGIGTPESANRSAVPGVSRVPQVPGVPSPALSNAIADPPLRPLDATTNTLSGPVRDLPNALPDRIPAVRANPPPLRQVQRRVSGVPPIGERRFLSDEVMVSLPSHLPREAINAVARRHGLTLLDSQPVGLTGRTYHRWRIGDGRSVPEVIRALESDGAVGEAQPSYRFALQEPAGLPAHAARLPSIQYSLSKLQIPQAHRYAAGSGVLVAIIDSGIDTTHEEIAGAIEATFDAVGSREPAHAHGTAIAGAVAAKARLKGIAPSARLLAIRAFDGSNKGEDGTTLTVLRSIDWAVARGARVINMSFAGPHDPSIARALTAAKKKGIVLVAAAGNAGPGSPPLYPAADANVIAVTATDFEDRLFTASNRGRHVAVAAPGVEIILPAPRGTYQLSSGTSFAAAHISGIVALLLELQPDLKPYGVRKVLEATAKDLGAPGRDSSFGAGLADAYRAVVAVNAAQARAAPPGVSAAR